MIPVTPQTEPSGFDANVRQRGKLFLGSNLSPRSEDFKPHMYWKWAAVELYEAYRHICAYSCMYIPIGPGTIDHFQPKTKYPATAFEWGNFRLALHKMNTNKGDNENIIDPFLVQPGWFVLDFPSCLVRPGDGLEDKLRVQIENSIQVLKLNKDDGLVQERCDIMVMFSQGEVRLAFLEKRYPFLAVEIVRQAIQSTAHEIFKKPGTIKR